MDCRQDDGAGIRMTGAKVINEFLAQLPGCIDVEDEERRPLIEHGSLRLRERSGYPHPGPGHGLLQRGGDFDRDLLVRFDNENLDLARCW